MGEIFWNNKAYPDRNLPDKLTPVATAFNDYGRQEWATGMSLTLPDLKGLCSYLRRRGSNAVKEEFKNTCFKPVSKHS